ncbi:MAG: methyltransferase domain-containing protein [Planctomycetes bacterium]|nr:methyltransferase domain-containing protein [Planctomycetota bacterium]
MGDELTLPEFLASLGKTELKPGGSYATGALLRMLELGRHEHLLVVGPHAGNTALFASMTTGATTEALVKEEGEKVTEGDPALKRRSTARVGKAEEMPFADNRFDAALIEATLAYQTEPQRVATLKEAFRVLNPGGRVGLHELCWRQPPTPEVEQCLGAVWRGDIRPLVVRGWWDLLEEAGFQNVRNELAVVSYFTRQGMTADEGEQAVEIFHNAFETPERLQRFSQAYHEFADNRRYYGVIIATAVKPV